MGYMENTLIHPNKRFRQKYDLSLKLYCDGLKSTTGVQLSTTFIHLMERYEKVAQLRQCTGYREIHVR
jgi:hypothetical protein